MIINIKRDQNIEHAMTSARLSGIRPSKKFLELADQYRRGDISAAELVLQTKKQHEYSIGQQDQSFPA
ncbi:hypothetical protein ACNFH8_02665 [Pseudomonas sp. NY15436]|uniref:antitoxin VbhA family protein n=1 Tax=Pseudomonas TaxID=286 RepID=UPI003A85ED39